MTSNLYKLVDGRLKIFFHPGQLKAWDSERRIVAIVAGTQGGKTEFLPLWLWREIRKRGPGDYGFISPEFTLMELKALPAFKKFFEETMDLGDYVGSPVRKFTVSPDGEKRLFGNHQEVPTCVYFGYAENPESLESATFKAVVLDEAGQKKFKRDSWEAIQRRIAIHQGRVCLATTPYNDRGWLRTEVIDRFRSGDPTVDLSQFESIMNPAFPREEFERARRTLPLWKFNLFYRGILSKPAGIIYDCFDDSTHSVRPFAIDPTWKRFVGVDFGGVNTAAVLFAEDPKSKTVYLYREYWEGHRTAGEHSEALKSEERGLPSRCVGGAKSEGQWRDEFAAAGYPIESPEISEVELGITRMYGLIKTNRFRIFNTCTKTLDQIASYSRVVDDAGEPTEAIEDKDSYHLMDACRYILGWYSVHGHGGGIRDIATSTRRDPW